ncbi:MAG: type II toxin-antitoxin system Phd/YefM family antitoxin [Patescibacteria group bacterium]|nr:type II toxin-antitoxin system Phd/YefM family antitoxin [Patescibacteria group bacterium]
MATLRNNLADTINEVENNKDYLLVLRRGGPVSALVNLDFFEDLLALTNKKYLNSIKKAREEVKKGDIFSHEDVFGDL